MTMQSSLSGGTTMTGSMGPGLSRIRGAKDGEKKVLSESP